MMNPEDHRKWWDKLRKLRDEGDVRNFWITYRQFLMEANIISEGREIIFDMATLTIEELE